MMIRNKVSVFIKVDFVGKPQPRWHRFIRIRVEVDVSAPLIPGLFLPRKDLSDVWIGLKYEKLSDLCYKCGVIGHDANSCTSNIMHLTNPFGHCIPAFGVWLHSNNDALPPGIYDVKNALPDSSAVGVETFSTQVDLSHSCR
jgi:hypothetical protein